MGVLKSEALLYLNVLNTLEEDPTSRPSFELSKVILILTSSLKLSGDRLVVSEGELILRIYQRHGPTVTSEGF